MIYCRYIKIYCRVFALFLVQLLTDVLICHDNLFIGKKHYFYIILRVKKILRFLKLID